MRREYLSSSQLWLGCVCSMAALSEPAWGSSPILYANSVGWLVEPAFSSSRFLPGITFGTVLSDQSSKDAGLLVLASGDADSDVDYDSDGNDDDDEDDNEDEDDDDSEGDDDRDEDDDDDESDHDGGGGGSTDSGGGSTDGGGGSTDGGGGSTDGGGGSTDGGGGSTDGGGGSTDGGGGSTDGGGGSTDGGGGSTDSSGGGDTGGDTGGGAATPSEPTSGDTPTVSGAPASRLVSADSAVRPRIGSGGGSWSRVVSSDDNPFEPYFENNVSPQNLAKILAYFGLVDSFAGLPDDGHVDIVWLEFERKPSLKGLTIVIDGSARAPDLSAVAGKLAVLIFLDQSTLTKGSEVVAVFGNADADGANMAKRRPLR
jgi:hypothetical protein